MAIETQTLIRALRSASVDAHRCLGCDFENHCSIHGCQLMQQAADRLAQMDMIAAQKRSMRMDRQAAFRLGQMDMRESVVAMLRDAANELPDDSIVGAALFAAGTLVAEMEVP